MDIRYTAHARERMKDRGVEPAWVERALLHPDWTQRDPSYGDVTRYYKVAVAGDARVLRVAACGSERGHVVITAVFDRSARRLGRA